VFLILVLVPIVQDPIPVLLVPVQAPPVLKPAEPLALLPLKLLIVPAESANRIVLVLQSQVAITIILANLPKERIKQTVVMTAECQPAAVLLANQDIGTPALATFLPTIVRIVTYIIIIQELAVVPVTAVVHIMITIVRGRAVFLRLLVKTVAVLIFVLLALVPAPPVLKPAELPVP